MEGTKIECYSKKMLDKLYPDGGYTLLGETKRKNKKEQTAVMAVWRSKFIVSELDSNNTKIYGRKGYVWVDQDTFVVVLQNRFAFLFWLLGILAGLGLAGLLLWGALRPNEPQLIDPDHPLPTEDPYSESIPDETGEKVESEEGGGFVSMIYTLNAEVDLSEQTAKIYFRNPGESNHDIKLILYAISEGEEYPLAESGLIKAGSGLEKMDLLEGAVKLKAGMYAGKYKLYYYDAKTGEKALVEPEIADLVITVNK